MNRRNAPNSDREGAIKKHGNLCINPSSDFLNIITTTSLLVPILTQNCF